MATNERSTDAIAARPIFKAPAVRSWTTKLARFARYKPLGAAGGAILLTMVLVAVFAPYIATTGPTLQDADVRLFPPSSDNFFGTDHNGRDVFSRVVYGTRISFYVGIMAVFIGSVSGTILGVSSGYSGGWFDLLIQRIVDALLGFPSIVLAMVLVVALGASLFNVTLAIGLVLIPRMTRLSRSSALSVKEEVYVTAAQAIGRGDVWGTLEPGKAADILVVDGDPSQDVSILRDKANILMTVQDGRVIKDIRAKAPVAA